MPLNTRFFQSTPRFRLSASVLSVVAALVALQSGSAAQGEDASRSAETPKSSENPAAPEKNSVAENLQGQKPFADFKNLRHDFGMITRGQKVSFSFEFKNTGSGVLQIRSIHSACGCINTRVEPKDVFLPSESGKISFEFDSSNFAGPIVRTLTLDTNQTRNSTQTLTFTANVREEIRAMPALLGVGEVLPEYNKAWLIQLPVSLRASGIEPEVIPPQAEKAGVPAVVLGRLKDAPEVKPLFATSSHPSIVAEIVPPDAKNKDHQLKVTFKGGLPIGPLREKVSVWNSSRHLKELVVPIYGDVVGHVKQSAKYVEFGVVTRPDFIRRALTFTSDRKDFVVESVTAELRRTEALEGIGIADLLKYSTVKTASGTQLNFELRYPDKLTSNFMPVNASGVFIVRTNDPDYKEVKIPFFGVLRQEAKR